MKDVEDYVSFGTHRTGSPGDRATSDWFAKHFRAHGYAVEQTDVTCPNADTTVASLTSGEIVLNGFAQPPAGLHAGDRRYRPGGDVNAAFPTAAMAASPAFTSNAKAPSRPAPPIVRRSKKRLLQAPSASSA